MTSLKDIKLYTTQAHPCSYLRGQQAKTLFIDPELPISQSLHTELSELGFRRSGSHIYRPHCLNCQSCVPCRVAVRDFSPNRRFRRIVSRNGDLSVTPLASIAEDEYYQLYAQYINTRHHDGDMYPATPEQFESFLASTCESTRFFSLRNAAGRLLGVIVCDLLDNGLSAVYTFYDIREDRRSLGGFAILWQIEEATRRGLPYVYLGYWIRDCRKMNYKIQYRPLELLVNGRWVLLK